MGLLSKGKPGVVEWPSKNDLKPYDVAHDTVSGFTGKVTAVILYANGCVRYELSGAKSEDFATGHVEPVSYMFDREQLELVEKAPEMAQPKPTGGSRSITPPQR